MDISNAIQNFYNSHPFYKNRTENDSMFVIPNKYLDLKDKLHKAITFVEDYQLLDTKLWKKFVLQFKEINPCADDIDNGWRGEYWGKMMRGACFTYSYTRNRELYDILTDTVKDMMTAQDENNRISTYSVENEYHGWDIWSRKYVILGLQYFIEICNDKSLIEEITDCICRQADYILDTIGPADEGKKPITDTSDFWLGLNSSSLLEPIVRLYNLTNKQKYLDFASYIVENGGISTPDVSIFELAYEDKLNPSEYPTTKAYEMMSCFEGLIEYYRVTGIEKWKTAAINFANRVRISELSVIGCAGCTHELFDNSSVRQTNTEYIGIKQETCVTVTWMKLAFQILCLTGNSVFADEIEKSIYNALLGSINSNKVEKYGHIPFDSYSPLLFDTRMRGIGGKKYMSDGSFYGCCACIGSAGTGLIGMYASMLTNEGFNINLYAPAKYNIPAPSGKLFRFSLETEYPVDNSADILIESDSDEEIEIGLRIPEWSENTIVSVNGDLIEASSGTYAKTKRIWKSGDYISIRFGMECKLHKAIPNDKDPNAQYHVCLTRGPLVLARDARLPGNIESIVNFVTDENGNVICKPFKNDLFDCYSGFEVKSLVETAEKNENKSKNKDTDSVTTAETETIQLVDYASAGKTWDKESMTTVWMPTKNYFEVDILSPINITTHNSKSSSVWGLYVNKDGYVCACNSIGDSFTLEPTTNSLYKIKHQQGKYLAVAPDGERICVNETGSSWIITCFAQNRYKICTEDGKAAFYNKFPFVEFTEPSYSTEELFRFNQAGPSKKK